jgi:F-type H+-transporting ATPase subunit b
MRRLPFALMAILSGLPILASEGEGGWTAPLWGIPTWIWMVFNLGLVILLFHKLLRKRAPAFFRNRAEEIREALSKALREKEDALARLKEVEEKMARLDDEVKSIETEALAMAAAEKVRLEAEAEVARERIRKEAADEIERRLQEARRDLRKFSAGLVEDAARELLAREIQDKDEERLIEGFFENLKEQVRDRAR